MCKAQSRRVGGYCDIGRSRCRDRLIGTVGCKRLVKVVARIRRIIVRSVALLILYVRLINPPDGKLYRASLVPANMTNENPYWNSSYPFYDAFFWSIFIISPFIVSAYNHHDSSSWDTFRTVHPLLSLMSPREWSEIVNSYIDGWRNTGMYFTHNMK